jgi:hypothetical protein
VDFTPDASKGTASKFPASGKIKADGTFQLTTQGKPGAEPGWYKVTIVSSVPGEPATKDPTLPSRYSNSEKSPLSIEVVDGTKDYELKLEK